MPNTPVKVSSLDAISNVASTDLILVTQSGSSKKITLTDFLTQLAGTGLTSTGSTIDSSASVGTFLALSDVNATQITNGLIFWDGNSAESDANITWSGSALDVTGALDITGISTLTGAVNVTGNVDVIGDISLEGQINFDNDTDNRIEFDNTGQGNYSFRINNIELFNINKESLGSDTVSVLSADFYVQDEAGIGMTSGIDSNAILELSSSTKGLLLPRMSDPDTAIGSATDGMIAYDTTDNEIRLRANGAWVGLGSGGGSGDVTKVGTPVDNQVGVWTGDGTIEGDADFTWSSNTATFTNVTGNTTTIVGPQVTSVIGTGSGGHFLNGAGRSFSLFLPGSGITTYTGGVDVKVGNDIAGHDALQIAVSNDPGTADVVNAYLLTVKNRNTEVVHIQADGSWDYKNNDLTNIGKINIGVSTELVISSGAITITRSNHTVDTESDSASDDLDTINGGVTGDILYLRTENDARDVVIKHGTGNILTHDLADVTIGTTGRFAYLMFDGSNWLCTPVG